MRKLLLILSFILPLSLFGQPMKALVAKKASASVTYATLDPANKYANTLSGGDLTMTHQSGFGSGAVASNLSITIGGTLKRRFQVTCTDVTGVQSIGVFKSPDDVVQIPGQEGNSYTWWSTGDFVVGNVFHGSPSAWSATHTLDCVLDEATGDLTFYYDGASQGVAFSGLTGTFKAIIGGQDNEPPLSQFTVNFGASAWTYSIPGTVGWY